MRLAEGCAIPGTGHLILAVRTFIFEDILRTMRFSDPPLQLWPANVDAEACPNS
jgi:hypothetical protein